MHYPTKFCALCLILLISAGCFRYNSDSAILTELVPGPGVGFSDEGIAAEYLTFADELTASVFRNMERRYRIAPAGTPLLCPSNPAPGMHGFALRGRVIQRMGNQAVADIEQRCQRPDGVISISSAYLLTRRQGKWRIEKPLEGSISMEAMAGSIVVPSIPRTRNPKRELQRLLAGIGVNRGRQIRIAISGQKRIQASALTQRGDSVLLENDDGTHAISIAEVDSVWAQKGTAALLVGSIAATPCAILGMMVGNFIATDPDSGRPASGAVGALIGGVLGALPCGLVGGAVGSFIRRWRLEYPRSLEPAG